MKKQTVYTVDFKERFSSKVAFNNVFKSELNSFRSVVEVFKRLENTPELKDYLKKYGLKFKELTSYEFVKRGLNLATLTDKNGNEYETICRTKKDGTKVPAKFSCWLVLTACEKVRKEEVLQAMKQREAAAKAKEESK